MLSNQLGLLRFTARYLEMLETIWGLLALIFENSGTVTSPRRAENSKHRGELQARQLNFNSQKKHCNKSSNKHFLSTKKITRQWGTANTDLSRTNIKPISYFSMTGQQGSGRGSHCCIQGPQQGLWHHFTRHCFKEATELWWGDVVKVHKVGNVLREQFSLTGVWPHCRNTSACTAWGFLLWAPSHLGKMLAKIRMDWESMRKDKGAGIQFKEEKL